MAVSPADRHDAMPAEPNGTGLLLLAGSSGRVEAERAEMLAREGVRTRAIRWFGGEGQRSAPHEVPIELFLDELDALRAECDRVAILGTSFGAEAALLTAAVTDAPLHAVIAIAPSAVVWAGAHEASWSSHWTLGGEPVPCTPFDPDWTATDDPPAFRDLYLASLGGGPPEAVIPVERIAGRVLLIVGGDDQVWPSDVFARMIADRRELAGLATEIVSAPGAGHRLLLPGETPAEGGVRMQRGGTPEADAELGALAWPRILHALR